MIGAGQATLNTYDWRALAEGVIAGTPIDREAARAILDSPDTELLSLLDAAYRIRQQHFGHKVHLYYLKNAKSGLCPEDCGYCSQSKIAEGEVERYAFLNEAKLMEGAAAAVAAHARTYCIVASGRGPTNREVDHIAKTVTKIKETYGLHICCCLGLLKPDQAQKLADAGVDRINHNLNTSRRYYDQICTTHTYQDRLDTLQVVRDAGIELCSGMIMGMGETHDDLVDIAFELRTLNVQSIPLNFLHAIDGTPLEGTHRLNPRDCLRALCLMRFANPTVELRVSGGREVNLRSMQAMALYPANSMFVSDYLTTKGQPAEDDFRMIEDLGFEVIVGDHETGKLWSERQLGVVTGPAPACGGCSH